MKEYILFRIALLVLLHTNAQGDLCRQIGVGEVLRFVCNEYDHNSQTQDIGSSDWKPKITVNMYFQTCILNVMFDLPAEGSSMNFSRFRITLVDEKQVGLTNKTIIDISSPSVHDVAYNFSGVRSGVYRITVAPIDMHPNTRRLCQCWAKLSNDKDCRLCPVIHTDFLNLTNPFLTSERPVCVTEESQNLSGSTKDSVTTLTDGTTISTSNDMSPGSWHHLAAGTVGFLVVLAAAVCFMCTRRRWSQGRHNSLSSYGVSLDTDITSSVKETDVFAAPEVRRLRTLLLASEDHRHFSKAVNMFAEFLQIHCQCDVVLPRHWLAKQQQSANVYCWLSRQIDNVDLIILVTSEAAARLYAALQENQAYREADHGPEGDLFTLSIQHICWRLSCQETVARTVVVHFHHTSPTWRLPIAALPTRQYCLPAQLTPFLRDIHQLDDSSTDLSNVNLPLKGNVRELPGGKEWIAALQSSFIHEHNNPDWFRRAFGHPVDIRTSSATKADPKEKKIGQGARPNVEFDNRPLRGLLSVSTTSLQKSKSHCYHVQEETSELIFEDFLPPEVYSCVTVSYCVADVSNSCLEHDTSSTFSSQIRSLNTRYEAS